MKIFYQGNLDPPLSLGRHPWAGIFQVPTHKNSRKWVANMVHKVMTLILCRKLIPGIVTQYKKYTSHISSSLCWANGSKLNLTVPLKRVGSWGIIPKRDLRSWSPIEHISMWSTTIFPPTGSTKRNKAPINVVFPLPVLPTIPILSPPSNVQLIPRRTRGAPGLYLTCFRHRIS